MNEIKAISNRRDNYLFYFSYHLNEDLIISKGSEPIINKYIENEYLNDFYLFYKIWLFF